MTNVKNPSGYSIGISPCPNDTLAICAWANNLMDISCSLQPIFADIETLNQLALTSEFPFCKVSVGALSHLKNYRLLSCGAALGYKNGPKVVAKKKFDISELKTKRVVFPGQMTSAYALYRKLLGGCKEEQFLRFDRLLGHINQGRADAAVLIHESRFAYEDRGFCEICDLGEIWNNQIGLPIPLGVFVVRNDIHQEEEKGFVEHFRRSLSYGLKHMDSCDFYSSIWTARSSSKVRRQHIELYINDETHNLSSIGFQAIKALIDGDLQCPNRF